MLFIFSTPELIRNLWQHKTAVFLQWCQIRAVPLCHILQFLKMVVFGRGTVVEHLPQHPKIDGSSPASVSSVLNKSSSLAAALCFNKLTNFNKLSPINLLNLVTMPCCLGLIQMFKKLACEVGLFKSSSLAPILGFDKFLRINYMNLVTLVRLLKSDLRSTNHPLRFVC